MTTGNRYQNLRYVTAIPPAGAGYVGDVISTEWSGGDAIKPATPRGSYVLVERVPRVSALLPSDLRLLRRGAKRLGPEHRKLMLSRITGMVEQAVQERDATRSRFYEAVAHNYAVAAQNTLAREKYKANKKRRSALPPQGYYKTVTHDTNHVYLSRNLRLNKLVWGANLSLPACYYPLIGDYDQAEYQKLLKKVRRKAYGSDWNPAVFGVEAGKAFNMVSSSASQIYGALGSLVARDWRGVFRNLRSLYQLPPKRQAELKAMIKSVVNGQDYGRRRKAGGWDKTTGEAYVGAREGIFTISTAWLALQHGWIPLVNDMTEGARYLAMVTTLDSPGPHQMLVASRSYAREYSGPAGLYANDVPAGYTTVKDEVQMRVRIYRFKRSNPALPSLATVASAAWEKAPLSWIMDYAFQIQNYLEALRTVSDVTGTIVFSVKTQRTFGGIAANKDYYYMGHVQGMSAKKQMQFTRTVSNTLPDPGVSMSNGREGVFSRWERTMNILSAIGRGSFNAVLARTGLNQKLLGNSRLSKPIF